MNLREQKQVALRYKNQKARIQGASFEDLINTGCDYYRERGIADIEKTPEPMRPVQDLGGGRFVAVYTEKAQADYKGYLYGGRAVYFEAKATETGKMMQSRVTENQKERLDRAYQMGAVTFVLCSIGNENFYRIPWKMWKNMKTKFGHKFFTPQEAGEFEIRLGGPRALLFLEGIEIQENGIEINPPFSSIAPPPIRRPPAPSSNGRK